MVWRLPYPEVPTLSLPIGKTMMYSSQKIFIKHFTTIMSAYYNK